MGIQEGQKEQALYAHVLDVTSLSQFLVGILVKIVCGQVASDQTNTRRPCSIINANQLGISVWSFVLLLAFETPWSWYDCCHQLKNPAWSKKSISEKRCRKGACFSLAVLMTHGTGLVWRGRICCLCINHVIATCHGLATNSESVHFMSLTTMAQTSIATISKKFCYDSAGSGNGSRCSIIHNNNDLATNWWLHTLWKYGRREH